MQRTGNKLDHLEVNLLILPVVAISLALARFAAPMFGLLPPCLFRTLTHLPCPSCGATRAGLALANGDLAAALYYNPLFVAGLGVLLTWSTMPALQKLLGRIFSPALPQNLRTHFSRVARFLHKKQFVRWLVLGAIVLNWLYLVLATP